MENQENKKMNKYESVIITDPTLEEKEIENLITKITDLINANGEVTNVDKMGIRKLAYEIKKRKEAYYILFEFSANPDLITELERNYRINDDIMKFITVRKDD